MRHSRLLMVVQVLIFGLAGALWATSVFSQEEGKGARRGRRPERVPGEFVVILHDRSDLQAVKARVEQFKEATPRSDNVPRIKSTIDRFNAVEIFIPESESYNFEADLSKDKRIKIIEPNYIFYPTSTIPNDTLIKDMWHLKNIDAFRAWDVQRAGSGITVAVIDTGIFITHDDLAGNVIPGRGYDFGDDDNDPSPALFPDSKNPVASLLFENRVGEFLITKQMASNCEVHGTHVAGIIGAVGDNGLGVTGINWSLRLLPIKCSSRKVVGFTTATLLKAIDYALNEKAQVINMSWGSYKEPKALKEAIQEASERALFIAAAGNDGSDNDAKPHYPSGFSTLPNLISVAATDENDKLADFSNYGEKSIDIAAPGVKILSTVPSLESGRAVDIQKGSLFKSDYDTLSGTSMATPLVTGTAALVFARDPGLKPHEVKTILLNTADSLDALDGKVAGKRRLNVSRAVSPPLPTPQNPKAMNAHEHYKLFLSGIKTSHETGQHDESRIPFEFIIKTTDVMDENSLVKSIKSSTQQRAKCVKIERLPPRSRHMFLIQGTSELDATAMLNIISHIAGVEWAEANNVFRPEPSAGS